MRKYRITNLFGLTMEQYGAMVEACGGKCQICGEPPSGRYKNLAIDHDHKTGEVRGLLCHRCNMPLAWFEQHADAAKAYLGRKR